MPNALQSDLMWGDGEWNFNHFASGPERARFFDPDGTPRGPELSSKERAYHILYVNLDAGHIPSAQEFRLVHQIEQVSWLPETVVQAPLAV